MDMQALKKMATYILSVIIWNPFTLKLRYACWYTDVCYDPRYNLYFVMCQWGFILSLV